MKTIQLQAGPGQNPRFLADEEAIRQGFNCYSKPGPKTMTDFTTPKEAVFYYSKNLEPLEVVVTLPGYDPYSERPETV